MFNIFAGVKDKRFIKRGTILLILGRKPACDSPEAVADRAATKEAK